jgi:group I intron endonuclease
MGCLYQFSFPNGKQYLGITIQSFKTRIQAHFRAARKGDENLLYRAIRKYGKEAISIKVLVIANDWKYLCELERNAIKSFGTKHPNGYNMTGGGEGAFDPTDELREIRRQQMTGNTYNKGNKYWLGKTRSKETNEKIRKKLQGCQNAVGHKVSAKSVEALATHIKKNGAWNKGKKMSSEQIAAVLAGRSADFYKRCAETNRKNRMKKQEESLKLTTQSGA